MASQKKTIDPQNLSVSANKMVSLTIFAGNTHIASSTVKFKGSSEILAEGEIKDFEIGKGSDLVGKTLKVFSRVVKQGPSPKISLTHQFKNTVPAKFEFKDDVFEPGNLFFTYTTEYNFTN